MRFSASCIIPLVVCLVLLVSRVSGSKHVGKPFELFDGDRVVFVGNTFIERAIDYGYIELALTTQWPDRTIIFRNLGWSGDDARGRSRRFFGPIEDGFNHLKTHVEELKPTVIFVSYGAMEAFEGKAGLEDFETHMNRLLDTFTKTKARIVLLSTIPQEKLPPPMPDPKQNNKNLKLYADAIESIAKKRGHHFIDLFTPLAAEMAESPKPLTDNGVHLNAAGYQTAAAGILRGMGIPNTGSDLELSGQGVVLDSTGVEVDNASALDGGKLLLVRLKESRLAEGGLKVVVRDLFTGDYTLRISGRELGPFSSSELSSGVLVSRTPSDDQSDLLLETIRTKNEFYFHKWRPQNETYLRGFRKHEQGQNAVELEQFDAFIEAEEQKINDLKTPRFFNMQLQREPKN
jgi:lysophospholipase L1-like esterase